MLHPEIAQKAQAQIDEVVGTGQLPTLEDRPELPYIDCIIKEVLRYAMHSFFQPKITQQGSTTPQT